ncbi:claudin-8-like [Periophthalmus magnuspinnatus]|uniref:claudin-8-like n=1 Tax=Periophthalmus magnuspinnatus TaxID=409849 RepID=UPI00145C0E23|nr:claudin-8-like [Periophthalmus magnuspinnatus]
MRAKLEILALVLGSLGIIGIIAITAMPQWRVSAFIGANLIVMEDRWEGLWMNCFKQIDRMQCKVYDSLLILPVELQASRGLMCASIVLAVIAFIITISGSEVTSCCIDHLEAKTTTLATGGVFFLLACLTTLIPVCWVAHTVIRDFNNPILMDAQRRELGAALYVGWATAGILLTTGVILLLRFCQRRGEEKGGLYPGEYALVPTAGSVYLNRVPSSTHKTMEYV